MSNVVNMTFRPSHLEPWQKAAVDRVLKLLADRELKKGEFATKTDTDPGLMSQMLTKKRPIGIDAAVRMARTLQCQVDDFSPELAQQIRVLAEVVAWPNDPEREWPFTTSFATYWQLSSLAKSEIDKFIAERVLLQAGDDGGLGKGRAA